MAFLSNDRPPRAPLLNAPSSVLWLIAALFLLHGLRVLLPGDLPDEIVFRFALVPARYAPDGGGEFAAQGILDLVVPFVTYIFLHGDLTHVAINSLWLLVFGPIVARRLGGVRFLLFFLFCGVASAMLHLFVYLGSPMAMVGASGGVSGLMAAGMRILYGRLYGIPGGLAPILSKPIVSFSLIWVIANVVTGLLRIGVTDEFTLIAWVAHLGGYFAGLAAIGSFAPASGTGRESQSP